MSLLHASSPFTCKNLLARQKHLGLVAFLVEHHRREDLTRNRVSKTRNLQLNIGVLELIEIQALILMEELKMEFEAKKSGTGSEEVMGRLCWFQDRTSGGNCPHSDFEFRFSKA